MFQHIVIIPDNLIEDYTHKLKSRPPKGKNPLFLWHLRKVQDMHLLMLEQFGYLFLCDRNLSIEEDIVSEIEYLEPEDCYPSVDPNPKKVMWAVSPYPLHKTLNQRMNQAINGLKKCTEVGSEFDLIEKLNSQPIKIHGKTFPPIAGITGLLYELQESYNLYIEHTGVIKAIWNHIMGRTPWIYEEWWK